MNVTAAYALSQAILFAADLVSVSKDNHRAGVVVCLDEYGLVARAGLSLNYLYFNSIL